MAMIYLESKDNPKIKHLRGLIEQNTYRKKQFLKARIYVSLGLRKNVKSPRFSPLKKRLNILILTKLQSNMQVLFLLSANRFIKKSVHSEQA